MGVLRWIEALPIAILVAFLKDRLLRNPGSENRILIPRRYEYLQRMDFFKAVGATLPRKIQAARSDGKIRPRPSSG